MNKIEEANVNELTSILAYLVREGEVEIPIEYINKFIKEAYEDKAISIRNDGIMLHVKLEDVYTLDQKRSGNENMP